MLNVLSKFKNVCAHNEKLFRYKTQKSILNLPIHNTFKNNCIGKNDLFAVCVSLKYLLASNDFNDLIMTHDWDKKALQVDKEAQEMF